MEKEKKRRLVCGITLFLFFAVLTVFTICFWNKLTAIVADPESFRKNISEKGFGGKAVFVLLMAAQVVLAIIPGHPFEVAGGYCFGVFEGLLLTSLGALIGSAAAFLLARIFGAKTFEIFYNEEKIQKVSFLKTTKRRNLLAFITFLIPGVPKDMLAYFMGVTKMKFGTFLLISTVGRLPGILIAVLAGSAVVTNSKTEIILFCLLLLFMALAGLGYFLYSKKKKAKIPNSNEPM